MKKQLTVVKKIPWKSRKSCWLTYHCIVRVCSYFVIFPCIKFDVTPLTPILCPWQWNRPFSVFELFSEIWGLSPWNVQNFCFYLFYFAWKLIKFDVKPLTPTLCPCNETGLFQFLNYSQKFGVCLHEMFKTFPFAFIYFISFEN